jgi:hypothetical protein
MYTEQEARLRLSNSPLRLLRDLNEKPQEKEPDFKEEEVFTSKEVAK